MKYNLLVLLALETKLVPFSLNWVPYEVYVAKPKAATEDVL